MKKSYPASILELKKHILSGEPSLYLGSQTSTVIPFDKLPKTINEITFCYLEKLPKEMTLNSDNDLEITGPVTWQEARSYLRSKGRDLKTTPTEELACMIAGIATSATGERCFGLGTYRSHIKKLTYIDVRGDEITLSKDQPFLFGESSLRESYQDTCKKYASFKNPPYPNFQNEIDLLIGTEGQMGVITSATIETRKYTHTVFLMMPLPKWEQDMRDHLKIFKSVQNLRSDLICAEFIDHNSARFFDEEDNIDSSFDYIVFELEETKLEAVFEMILTHFDFIDPEKILELSHARFQEIRTKIPRGINEINSRTGIKKLGTDVQALGSEFEKLLMRYKEFAKSGIPYCLFGHFGDGHLHFNFIPNAEQEGIAKAILREFYKDLSLWNVSPFAEHGIGVIKQDYIKDYYGDIQRDFFRNLKNEHDPNNQFFPLGFMTSEK